MSTLADPLRGWFHRGSLGLALAVAVTLLGARSAPAATIESLNLSTLTVNEGDDFLTLELNRPLTFDDGQRRGFGWEEGFAEATIQVTGGLWTGSFEVAGAGVYPLWAGLPGLLNDGLFGAQFPIDSTRFTLISIRSRASARGQTELYWTHQVGDPDFSLLHVGPPAPRPAGEFVLDLYDLSSTPGWTSAPVRALRHHPAGFPASLPVTVDYDWVRIVDPSSAPIVTVTWNVTDLGTGTKVLVFVDPTPGCDESTPPGGVVGQVDAASGSGTFSLPSAALPPGTYCVGVALVDGGGAVLDRAGPQTLVVNGQPQVTFQAPSRTSGTDYATEVVGNPWDLADSPDVAALTELANPTFSGGDFTAVTTGPDPQIFLNVDPARPIPTSRFRWATFQLGLDKTGFGNVVDRLGRGWVARLSWFSQGIQVDGTITKALYVYEGLSTITVDLWADGVPEPLETIPAQIGWRALPTVSVLAVEPAEVSQPTGLLLADVKLTAQPTVEGDGTYTIRFALNDPEGDQADANLFLDTDRSGFDGEFLTSIFGPPGDYEVTVDLSTLPPGSYWLYTEVTDGGGATSRRYADAPLVVLPAACFSRAILGDRPAASADRADAGEKPGRPEDCAGR